MATRRINTASASSRGVTPAPVAAPAPAPRKRTVQTEETGRGFVSTAVKDRDGVYDETQREVEVLRAKFNDGEQVAQVRVGGGLTISMGNYESLRVDCSVTIPCLPTQLDEAYEIASQFVADRVSEEQARWLGTGNESKQQATPKKGGR